MPTDSQVVPPGDAGKDGVFDPVWRLQALVQGAARRILPSIPVLGELEEEFGFWCAPPPPPFLPILSMSSWGWAREVGWG